MWIIDLGSGNTCKNDRAIVRDMIDAIDPTPRDDMVLKWQLFQTSKINTPLDREVFEYAYNYAKSKGFRTTSSVADKDSLDFLKGFDVPFVKIPCRPDLYTLIPECAPLNVVVSVGNYEDYTKLGDTPYVRLLCIREYPAYFGKYLGQFLKYDMLQGLSDHSEGWNLWILTKPRIYECHMKLENSTGPDAGSWARLPEEIIARRREWLMSRS